MFVSSRPFGRTSARAAVARRVLLSATLLVALNPLGGRETVAARMAQHGIHVEPEQILLTNGSQHGIDLVLRLVAAPGRSVPCTSRAPATLPSPASVAPDATATGPPPASATPEPSSRVPASTKVPPVWVWLAPSRSTPAPDFASAPAPSATPLHVVSRSTMSSTLLVAVVRKI